MAIQSTPEQPDRRSGRSDQQTLLGGVTRSVRIADFTILTDPAAGQLFRKQLLQTLIIGEGLSGDDMNDDTVGTITDAFLANPDRVRTPNNLLAVTGRDFIYPGNFTKGHKFIRRAEPITSDLTLLGQLHAVYGGSHTFSRSLEQFLLYIDEPELRKAHEVSALGVLLDTTILVDKAGKDHFEGGPNMVFVPLGSMALEFALVLEPDEVA